MRRVRLLERDGPRTARRAHRVVIALHFHGTAAQHLHQRIRGSRVMLFRVDHVLLTFAVRHLCPRHLYHRPHYVATHLARHAHQTLGRNQLIIHDVAQPPGATFPRTGIVHARFVLQTARVGRHFVGGQRNRRGDLRAGCFGEQPDHVVARGR